MEPERIFPGGRLAALCWNVRLRFCKMENQRRQPHERIVAHSIARFKGLLSFFGWGKCPRLSDICPLIVGVILFEATNRACIQRPLVYSMGSR